MFSFSTENWTRPAGGGRRPDGDVRRADRPRDARARRGGRADAVHRPARGGRRGACSSAWSGPRRGPPRNERITLFVAFNYGGRAEIVDAARSFEGGGEEEFRDHLYAPEMHDPDLLIRTSGEQRISNFLLWQCAYSELVFRDELWPDFDRERVRGGAGRVRDPRAGGSGAADGGFAPVRLRASTSTSRAATPAEPPPTPPPLAAAAPDGERKPPATRTRSETLARIAWALPWIAIAVTIAIVGGELFAAAMIGFACVGLAEFFRMTRDARPFLIVAFVGRRRAGRRRLLRRPVLQMMIALAASVLLIFAAAVAAPGARRDHGLDRDHRVRDRLDRDPVRPRGPAARAARPRRGAARRRARRDLRLRHRRLRRRAGCSAATGWRRRCRRTRRSRGSPSASSAARSASGSRASTRTGCRASTRC